jgi:hypothetical protein
LPNAPVPYATTSGFIDKTFVLVRGQAQWGNIWTTIHKNRRPVPEPPALDFARQMVLVAALGRRPTSGYRIELGDVSVENEVIRATVLIDEPGRGCIVSQGMTSPLDLLLLPVVPGELEIREQVKSTDCESLQ